MILVWMVFDFEVEVLEVLEGFKAWFLQSFCTFECFWIFSDAACALDGEEVKMLVGYNMQSYRANLVFLRTPGEVISEEYTSDYGEDMWESGWVCMCYRITQVKLR